MISITKDIDLKPLSVQNIKILENLKMYGDIAMFWEQNESGFYISLLDGNMTLSGMPSDTVEVKEFLKVINPKSIFAGQPLLESLGLWEKSEKVSVLKRKADIKISEKSDVLSSKDVYGILKQSGLYVPEYEFFAVDFCRRINSGGLKYFGLKDKSAAISIGSENVYLSGVASLEKGFGTVVLKGILSLNYGKEVFVCCKENIKPFYIKNGFSEIYKAGYWRKNEFF